MLARQILSRDEYGSTAPTDTRRRGQANTRMRGTLALQRPLLLLQYGPLPIIVSLEGAIVAASPAWPHGGDTVMGHLHDWLCSFWGGILSFWMTFHAHALSAKIPVVHTGDTGNMGNGFQCTGTGLPGILLWPDTGNSTGTASVFREYTVYQVGRYTR